MSRILLVLLLLAGTAGAVVAYGDPEQIARASEQVSQMLRQRSTCIRARGADLARPGRRIRAAAPRSTASARRW